MTSFKRTTIGMVAAGLMVSAVLGSTLGIALARTRTGETLNTGFNLIGGPLGQNVTPDNFIGCLPANSWKAVYIWDGSTQQWKHYLSGVPTFVNSVGAGGIASIPNGAGVILLMNASVQNPKLKDSNGEAC
jgi:hypothetical protein